MDYYNVFLYGFCFLFLWIFFFKMVFIDFIFFILSWLIILLRNFFLKHCWLLQCFFTWFLFCYNVSPHVFFLNYLCRFFLKYWAGWEFSFNFPHMFFFYFFFILFFSFFKKHCLLLFSIFFFFCVFFFAKLFLLILFF